MSNLPSKFYQVEFENGDLIGVFTNKKLMWDVLSRSEAYRPYSIHSYWSFSQILKLNKRCKISTVTQSITIFQLVPNVPIR